MKFRTVWRSLAELKTRTATFGVAALAASFAATPAAALSECKKFGLPSYVADRTTTTDGHSVRSRVYAADGKSREEIDHGGEMEVIVTTDREFISFSPTRKIGVRRSLAAGGPKTPPGGIRSRNEPDGANTRVILEGKDDNGDWVALNEVVCSARGELLSRKFKIPINGRLVDSVMEQSIVSEGPLDPKLFAPPADIRFGR